jgi:hypothetical protein
MNVVLNHRLFINYYLLTDNLNLLVSTVQSKIKKNREGRN